MSVRFENVLGSRGLGAHRVDGEVLMLDMADRARIEADRRPVHDLISRWASPLSEYDLPSAEPGQSRSAFA